METVRKGTIKINKATLSKLLLHYSCSVDRFARLALKEVLKKQRFVPQLPITAIIKNCY